MLRVLVGPRHRFSRYPFAIFQRRPEYSQTATRHDFELAGDSVQRNLEADTR
jgi:hypothetical protein